MKQRALNKTSLLAEALGHHRAGRLADAERGYLEILALNRRDPDALHLLGLLLRQGGNLEQAAESIQKAIAIRPAEPIYHSNLGTVLQAQGDLKTALDCYRRAIALNPGYADAHNNLGGVLAAQNKIDDAIASYRRGLALDPRNSQAHNNLGLTLEMGGFFAEAAASYRKAIAIQPDFADAYNNLGNALQAQDNLDEATECYLDALKINPSLVLALNNLGNTFQAQDRLDDALRCYERALAIKPDYAQASFGKALAYLLQGDFAKGWLEFEWRWKTPGHAPMRKYSQPIWQGADLGSGRLLVWGEQGIGDEVMFAGLLPELTRQGYHCMLECEPRLQPLFARSFPDIPIVCPGSEDINFSAHIPSGSLPGLLRTFGASASPYLKPDPGKQAQLRARYQKGKRVVGIAWHTNNRKTGPRRSIALPHFNPLLCLADIFWVSLQYGDHPAPEAMHVDGQVNQLLDLDLFAAQISAVDLVITIDNSTAHLAGALGVPVWLLLPFAPDWRWLQKRSDSPWYPSMRIFRQTRLGDWTPVIQHVRDALLDNQ